MAVPLLVAAFLLLTAAPKLLAPEARDMTLFDIAAASPAPAPAPEPLPKIAPKLEATPIILPDVPVVPVLAPEVVTLLTEASAQAGACDLTAPVQAALRAEPGVTDAVARLPRDARSVANAIMVWNREWVPLDRIDPSILPIIRETIVATVGAATRECREANQGGPRFLSLGDAEATVVALGDGEWRWQDLIDSSKAPGLAVGGARASVLNSSRNL